MRIAIVGAGIAGLATALSLSGSGHEIVLLERRTGFGETGAGIQLSPNSARILLALGLGPALARMSSEPERVAVRDLRSGRDLAQVGLGPAMRERYGAPYWSIARADLHTILLDAVRSRSDIRIRVGRTASTAMQGGSTVHVAAETAGGSRDDVAADLVVGADGIWSRMRDAIGDRRRPIYSGYAAYRATVPADAAPPGLGGSITGLWLGRGCHVVHYAIAGGRTVNVVVVARRPAAFEGWSEAADPEEVLAALPPLAAPIGSLLAAAGRWTGWSLFDLPARRLGAGRVVLVGDAGHPVLPFLAQGGSLAIEDAAHLAAILMATAEDVPGAVARFGRERIARVRRVQAAARRNGRVYHARFPVAALRNMIMRRLGPDGMGERYSWLYGWHPPAAAPPA